MNVIAGSARPLIRAVALTTATLAVLVAAAGARADRHATVAENTTLRKAEARWFAAHNVPFSPTWQIGNVLVSTVDNSWAADVVTVGAESGSASEERVVVLRREASSWRVFLVTKATQGDCGVPSSVVRDFDLYPCGYHAPQPQPAATAHWYATTGTMEQDLEETGLIISGHHHDVLFVGCTGQGLPGGQAFDPKFGIKQPTYKQFLCLIQIADSNIGEIHIQTGGRGTYSWTALG